MSETYGERKLYFWNCEQILLTLDDIIEGYTDVQLTLDELRYVAEVAQLKVGKKLMFDGGTAGMSYYMRVQ